ncbi:thiamine phosphate synthase [Brevundimonas sp. AJA228-03]|uniref:thiamine phosphate synthase n=1 Tax=Brevundimonas sp. AJA228-03 TaxID=2752515 RepID=UPI001ADFC9B5|nr:thiamine phosphate synthase [Brevundimonas sp. AJA228-03]QTN19951.1 thiamine phosphate synthase [Brevundimonas sp. AJA228-03]
MTEPVMMGTAATRLWAGARALARAAAAVRGGAPSRVPPLLFFTDPRRTPRPWEIVARMPAGSGVVYRSFGANDARDTADRLRTVTAERGMALLIGMDSALAEAVGADGLHLPERALSAAYALSGRRPDWILTAAVHSVEAALAARDLDAVVLSPVFPAGGASSARTALGVQALADVAANRPVIALGGITADTVADLVRTGATGVAAVSSIAEAFAV